MGCGTGASPGRGHRPVGVGRSRCVAPALPLPPELAELTTADAHTFVRRLAPGFDAGAYGPAHRAVLVNLIASCRPAVLVDAADALERTHRGLALALADLARLRHRMLAELGVAI